MALIVLSEKIGPLEVLTYLVACPETGEALVVDPGGPAPGLEAGDVEEIAAFAIGPSLPLIVHWYI